MTAVLVGAADAEFRVSVAIDVGGQFKTKQEVSANFTSACAAKSLS
jgi:hypothetical protein